MSLLFAEHRMFACFPADMGRQDSLVLDLTGNALCAKLKASPLSPDTAFTEK